jgi:hypothetical protein
MSLPRLDRLGGKKLEVPGVNQLLHCLVTSNLKPVTGRFPLKLLTNCELRIKNCSRATHVIFFLFCRIWRNL